jgi:predicted HTH transcriptional regulator
MLEFRLERISISLKKEVLAFHIPEIAKKPFYIQDKDNPKIRLTYVRRADMTIKASREMEFVLRYRSNPQDWVFRYGWREQKVMEYLLNSPQITVAEAASLLQVPHKPAAITLVTLVRAGILQIIPTEHGDYFIVENKAFEQ